MTNILYTGLKEETLEVIKQHPQLQEVNYCNIAPGELKQQTALLALQHIVLIGEEIENPIRIAQEIYALDKYLSVIIINDSSSHQKVKQALQFSPFIGPTVQCVSNEIKERLAGIVEDAASRTEQRRSFARIKATAPPIANPTSNAVERVKVDYTAKVLEEAPIGATLVSQTGVVLTINAYAAQLFGKSEREILSTPFFKLFPDEKQQSIHAYITEGYQQNPSKTVELVLHGERCFLEITVAPMHYSEATGYRIIIINNVTSVMLAQLRTQAHLEELEKLNADLKRVNTDLDTFVYSASHDLKSPIINIESLVEVLEENLGPAQASVKMELDLIKNSVKRFKDTIEDLTEVARIQRNFDYEATQLEVDRVVEEVKYLILPDIERTGAIITADTAAAPLLYFPKRNLKSILYNLISNAIKYSSPERQPLVRVSTGTEGEYFFLRVQDNGLGIPKDKHEKVFELFKRMHSHVKGNGVGLYIVKRIAENSGGFVQVKSKEGQGAEFSVYLKVNEL